MPKTRRLHAGRSGFTVLETVVVLALVGLLLVAALPSYSNFVSNQRLEAAGRLIASDLRVARQEAVTRRAPVAIGFAAADANCLPTSASYTVFHGPVVLKRTCLPGNIEWAPVPAVRLVIQSVGIPQTGMRLTVRSTRTGARRSVTISAESGAVDGPR